MGPSAVSSACSQTLVVVIYVHPKDAPMYPHVHMRYGYVLRYGELCPLRSSGSYPLNLKGSTMGKFRSVCSLSA